MPRRGSATESREHLQHSAKSRMDLGSQLKQHLRAVEGIDRADLD